MQPNMMFSSSTLSSQSRKQATMNGKYKTGKPPKSKDVPFKEAIKQHRKA